jgi:hypothetical protein
VASFDVCYSFLPLNVESLLSKFEGAVLKFVKSGPAKAAPWIIFVKVIRTLISFFSPLAVFLGTSIILLTSSSTVERAAM